VFADDERGRSDPLVGIGAELRSGSERGGDGRDVGGEAVGGDLNAMGQSAREVGHERLGILG
jgi:hypothetical protein